MKTTLSENFLHPSSLHFSPSVVDTVLWENFLGCKLEKYEKFRFNQKWQSYNLVSKLNLHKN